MISHLVRILIAEDFQRSLVRVILCASSVTKNNNSCFRKCDCIEKAVTEKAVTEKAVTEKVGIEKVITEKAITEKTGIEKAVTEKAGIEKAVTEEASTEKVVTEKANISEFCYDGVPCLSDEDCFDGQCIAKYVIFFTSSFGH